MNLQNGDLVVTIKVMAQDGVTGPVTHTLTIKGDPTAPSISYIKVNGEEADAPTETEPRYTYKKLLSNATSANVEVKSTVGSAYIEINGGTRTQGTAAESVSIPLTDNFALVNVNLYVNENR